MGLVLKPATKQFANLPTLCCCCCSCLMSGVCVCVCVSLSLSLSLTLNFYNLSSKLSSIFPTATRSTIANLHRVVIKPSPCKTQTFGCLQIPTLKQVPSSAWAILLSKCTLSPNPPPNHHQNRKHLPTTT